MTPDCSEALLDPIDDVVYRPDCVQGSFDGLREYLQNQNWSIRGWTDAPNTTHPPHDHPYAHRVLAVSGWIEFSVGRDTYRLTPGDALDLPRRVQHGAVTSPEGPTEYWLLQPE